MIRVLLILAALVLGLVGLFMSICGGGFLLTSLVALFKGGPGAAGAVSIAMMAIPFILGGVLLVIVSVRFANRAAAKPRP